MKLSTLLFILTSSFLFSQNNFKTPFEKGNGNQTVTYDEMNAWYGDLAKISAPSNTFKKVRMITESRFM